MFFSQFLTLYITPVFYTYMEAFLERYNAWREGRPVVPALKPATKQIATAQTSEPADGRLAS